MLTKGKTSKVSFATLLGLEPVVNIPEGSSTNWCSSQGP